MIVYLNGAFVEDGEAVVSLFDGGFLHGDGLYETVRLYAGRPFDLPDHLARLARELELLGFSWRPDLATVRTIFRELAERNGLTAGDARARLLVSRGGFALEPLPLTDLAAIPPTIAAFVHPLSPELTVWQRDGIGVSVMRPPFARGNFPQLKTLNCLPPVMALRFAHLQGNQEALLVDRQGKVLEGTSSNLFLVRDDRLLTTPARLGILAGRTRALVLALAREMSLPTDEAACDRRDLATADEIFLSGSVKEIVPVVRVDGVGVADGRPGPVTRTLQERYRQAVRDSLATSGD